MGKKERKPFRKGTDETHQMNTTPSKRCANHTGESCGPSGLRHPKGCKVAGSRAHSTKEARKANRAKRQSVKGLKGINRREGPHPNVTVRKPEKNKA